MPLPWIAEYTASALFYCAINTVLITSYLDIQNKLGTYPAPEEVRG